MKRFSSPYSLVVNLFQLTGTNRALAVGWASWPVVLWLVFTLVLLPDGVGQAVGPDGTVDPTFKSGKGASNTVYTIAIQNDGKILIGGRFTTYNETGATRLVRLNPDGSVDTSFNIGTGFSSTLPNPTVYSIAVQNDGKILVGGQFTNYNGTVINKIARLNSDGSLDSNFNTGSGASGTIHSVAVQSDGKILLGGRFASYNGTSRPNIARLNNDGSLDTNFNVGTGASSTLPNPGVFSLVVQNDGKILIGGDFDSYNGTSRSNIARLNANGSLDNSFSVGSGFNSYLQTLAVQGDGKILVGGDFTGYNGTSRNYIARLNNDGSLDSSFNIGSGTSSAVYSVVAQSNGKILIGGGFSSYNGTSRNSIARLNSDGTLDSSFSVGTGTIFTVQTVAVQSDNKILIGGGFISYSGRGVNRLARLNTDGNLDTGFNTGTGSSGVIYSVALQSDGKIIIGGQFTTYNALSAKAIARLNNDGSLDSSFNTGSGVNNIVQSIVVQSDGKIIIGGAFTTYNGIGRSSIARLNTDGSLDSSFNVGTGTGNTLSTVYSVALQNDGKIIIGGNFTSYNGTESNRIARLNTDGSLDSSFNVGSGAGGTVNSVVVQNDGKVLIGGDFTSYNGTGINRIARLNSDGSLDSSFNVGSGANVAVRSLAVQSDGKILLGGSFTTYNDLSSGNIARLNTDGSPDTTFNVGSGATNNVYSVLIQSDGKILIGGQFNTFNGISRPNIVRLNSDGSLDNSFYVGRGPDILVYSVALQSDSKIIIVGRFTSVDTYTRDFIARLENVIKPASSVVLVSNPNPAQYGQNITFTATTNPITATGTVTFTFGTGASTTSVTSTLVSGIANYMTNTLPPGDTPVVASYSGDNNFTASASAVYTQSVTKAATDVSLTSSSNPAVVGTSLNFTATLSPVAASGLVTFTFSGLTTTTAPVINGLASYMTNTLPLGTYTVTATCGGDANYLSNTSQPYTQQITVACNPQVVTSSTDDGQASTCGTFSFALAQTSSGTISFALTDGNTITFNGSLTPTLKTGVAINGGAAGIVLNGNGIAGDGLRLGGGNELTNLTIRNFGGQELLATVSSAANRLFKVKVQS